MLNKILQLTAYKIENIPIIFALLEQLRAYNYTNKIEIPNFLAA